MHCSKCGAKLEEGTKFCSKCGADVSNQGIVKNETKAQNTNKDGKGTASLILGIVSFVVPCVGFITSIIGLILGIVCKEKGGKRTAGIILNAIALALIIIGSILVFALGLFETNKVSDVIEDSRDSVTENYNSTYDYDSDKDYDDDDGVTTSQKNAVKKAKSYLRTLSFSHDGLVKQLEFEKFSHEDAVYGADHCGADWNEQAVKKAKSYLNVMAFSHDGLVQQLEYEGFTHEQAEYGVTQAGL